MGGWGPRIVVRRLGSKVLGRPRVGVLILWLQNRAPRAIPDRLKFGCATPPSQPPHLFPPLRKFAPWVRGQEPGERCGVTLRLHLLWDDCYLICSHVVSKVLVRIFFPECVAKGSRL